MTGGWGVENSILEFVYGEGLTGLEVDELALNEREPGGEGWGRTAKSEKKQVCTS